VLWWLAVAYGVLLLWADLGPSTGPLAVLIADWIAYVPMLLLGAAVVWRTAAVAPLEPETRRSLRIFAIALVWWTLGNIGYTWTYVARAAGPEAFSVGEPLFLIGYTLLLVALLQLPRRRPRSYRGWHAMLDTLIVVVGGAALAWDLIIAPTVQDGAGPVLLATRIIYPLFGTAYLLAVNAVHSGGGPREHRRAWRILASAVVAFVVADGFYQLINFGARAPTWFWWVSDGLYTVAYLGLLRAGWAYREPDTEPPPADAIEARALSPLPVVVVAGVLALLVIRASSEWVSGVSELGLALVLLLVLMTLRQQLVSLENERLARARLDREGDARAAALLRHASDLVLLTNGAREIRFASPSVAPLLGLDPGQLVGRPIEGLIAPTDIPVLRTTLREAGHGAGRSPVTLRFLRANGTYGELDVIVTDLTREPAVEGLVLVGRDLTERRALERRLQQAEKMEVVGRLAGGVAHDFNNLLTTILAESELLLDDPQAPAELDTIRKAAELGAGLARQLLTFSRPQLPSARAADVNELVSSCLRLLGKVDTAITVESHTAPSLHRAFIDEQQVQQAILNLLFNARDAMPNGGTLTLKTEDVRLDHALEHTVLPVAAGEHVRVTISDTGVGMEPEVFQRAFEPFFTTKPAGKGSGLGLASVLGTLRQHGAGLDVASQPGRGTRVEVYLPREIGPLEGAGTAPHLRGDDLPLGTERVLVVDDEPAVLDVTRRSLERFGYTVRAVADADSAARVLAGGWVPDILVTDVIMPEVSGPELVARLRPTWPDLPVLFISGFTGEELSSRGDLAAGEAFLAKPYTPVELGHRVRLLLDGREPGLPGTGEKSVAVPIS